MLMPTRKSLTTAQSSFGTSRPILTKGKFWKRLLVKLRVQLSELSYPKREPKFLIAWLNST